MKEYWTYSNPLLHLSRCTVISVLKCVCVVSYSYWFVYRTNLHAWNKPTCPCCVIISVCFWIQVARIILTILCLCPPRTWPDSLFLVVSICSFGFRVILVSQDEFGAAHSPPIYFRTVCRILVLKKNWLFFRILLQ